MRRLHHEVSAKGFLPLCRFSLEPANGVLVYDCTVVKAPDGKVFVYGPPSRKEGQVLSLAPDVRRLVIEMAMDAAGIDDIECNRAA